MNSDTPPDTCRTTCTEPTCGDGVIDSGEQCDDAAANDNTVPEGCATTCRVNPDAMDEGGQDASSDVVADGGADMIADDGSSTGGADSGCGAHRARRSIPTIGPASPGWSGGWSSADLAASCRW